MASWYLGVVSSGVSTSEEWGGKKHHRGEWEGEGVWEGGGEG